MNKKEFKAICKEKHMSIKYDPDMSKEQLYSLIDEINNELSRRTYHLINEQGEKWSHNIHGQMIIRKS